MAAMIPAKSAIKPYGIAYLDFLIPTEPKYNATIKKVVSADPLRTQASLPAKLSGV